MKKNWLIIALAIIIGVGIIIFTMYMIDMERMKHNYDVVFSTWGRKYTPAYKITYADDKENNNVVIDEDEVIIKDVEGSDSDSDEDEVITKDVEDSDAEKLNVSYSFKAKIEEVKEYKGKYSLLVSGLETNEINYKSKYWCSIKETTILLDKENKKIEVTHLKEGQTVSITYSGGVMESYPAQIGNVLKIRVTN